jgi:hypothetical protein
MEAQPCPAESKQARTSKKKSILITGFEFLITCIVPTFKRNPYLRSHPLRSPIPT